MHTSLSQRNITHYSLLGVFLFLVAVVIYTFHRGYYDPSQGDFITLAVLALAAGLYRPRWTLWFCIGFLPLEIINLAPTDLGFHVRPYQFLLVATLCGSFFAFLQGRLRLPRWHVVDLGVVLMLCGSLLAFVTASGSAKDFLIFLSFSVLYSTVRLHVRNVRSSIMSLVYLAGSSSLVVVYALAQNWISIHLGGGHAVMVGRPNATFTEADWLGMFLVIFIALLYAALFYLEDSIFRLDQSSARSFVHRLLENFWHTPTRIKFLVQCSFVFVYAALLITVARSAWIAFFLVHILFLVAILWQYGLRVGVKMFFVTSIIGVVAYNAAIAIPLTEFQIGKRVASAGGAQEITIACVTEEASREVDQLGHVLHVDALTGTGCSHINLEDINSERAQGNIVSTITRDDPNVSARIHTFAQSWEIIMQKPLFGHGWGASTQLLGTDEAGTQLNTSNIFLEVWLSAGVIGLLGLLIVLIGGMCSCLKNFLHMRNAQNKAFALFVLCALIAVGITNLFNAGIFLAITWLVLALSAIKLRK